MKTPITDAAIIGSTRFGEGVEYVSAEHARRLELICEKFARSVRDWPCGHKPNYAYGTCEACEALEEYKALAGVPNDGAKTRH